MGHGTPGVNRKKKKDLWKKEEFGEEKTVLELGRNGHQASCFFKWNCLLLFLFFYIFVSIFKWLLMLTMLSTESCSWLYYWLLTKKSVGREKGKAHESNKLNSFWRRFFKKISFFYYLVIIIYKSWSSF